MSDTVRESDIRHLTAYLGDSKGEGLGPLDEAVEPTLWIGFMAILAYLLFFHGVSWWILMVGFFGGSPVLDGFIKHFKQSRRNRDLRRRGLSESRLKMAVDMRELNGEGKLAKRIHPVAAQRLNDLARLAQDIRTALNQPHWSQDHPGAQWADIRKSSLAAVDDAMFEAIDRCYPYVRWPQQRVATFQQMITNDPHARLSAPIDDQIAKFASLQRELTASPESAVSHLDRALSQIAQVRAAESELDSTVQNHA